MLDFKIRHFTKIEREVEKVDSKVFVILFSVFKECLGNPLLQRDTGDRVFPIALRCEPLSRRLCLLSKGCVRRDKCCWVTQPVGRAWEVLGGPGGIGEPGPQIPPSPVCPYRMLVLAQQIRRPVSSQERQREEGLAPLCGDPAGERGWKTQLSVRLGAGGEVRAECLLFLWALRERLSSLCSGGGCIDQGQRLCVIKGSPGIKGALPKDSRMAYENPRRFSPSGG